ncbi:TPA: LexA family protein [Neisseria subflava]
MEPRHVHIVIANIGNEFTIKRLYQQNGVVELRSENRNRQNELPNYTFKDGDFLQVVGIVLHVIKKVG